MKVYGAIADQDKSERNTINVSERQENRWKAGRAILKLVLSADLPLFWKEILSYFCIDVATGTSNPKSRLVSSCKAIW